MVKQNAFTTRSLTGPGIIYLSSTTFKNLNNCTHTHSMQRPLLSPGNHKVPVSAYARTYSCTRRWIYIQESPNHFELPIHAWNSIYIEFQAIAHCLIVTYLRCVNRLWKYSHCNDVCFESFVWSSIDLDFGVASNSKALPTVNAALHTRISLSTSDSSMPKHCVDISMQNDNLGDGYTSICL